MRYNAANAKINDFNEFYTTYETAEKIFRPIVSYFMDKHIHCPCDSEQSNIVQWLKKNTNSTITFSGLPDIDMNSDEAHDLMLNVDMVVTNPPYQLSLWIPFVRWLLDNHIEFFVFGSVSLFNHIMNDQRRYIANNTYLFNLFGSNMFTYYRPDGRIVHAITAFYSSFELPTYTLTYKQSKKPQEFYQGIPVFNRSNNVPPDFDGWCYVPITFFTYYRFRDYEVEDCERIPGHYVRMKIRKKITKRV